MNGFGLVLPVIAKGSPTHFVQLPSDISSLLNRSKPEGFPAPGTQLTVSFTLPAKDVQGLARFVNAVGDPSSPYYRKFLSDAQFASLYGPDAREFKSLETYLQAYGLNVTYGGAGQGGLSNPNLYTLKASGSVGEIEQALKTNVKQFSYNGSSFFSATTPPSLPSQFSNVVKVGGLSSHSPVSSSLAPHEAVPLYRTLYQKVNGPGQNSDNFMYYSPSEIEGMYNVTSLRESGIDGTGVTIAIVDAYGDPYIQQELNQFDSEFGIPNQNISVICVDGPCDYSQGIYTGWNTEIALDVEWAHALAPNATINLYIGSDSYYPLYDAVEAAVMGTNGTSPYSPSSIISLSWGSPENDIASSAPVLPLGYGPNYPWLNQVLQQAAAQGITVFAATGDWGAYDQGFGQTSPYGGPIYPSTDPFVTGVGGTSLYANSSSGFLQYPYANATVAYGTETGWSWNNAWTWGTGGGCSTLFASQEWQDTGSFCAGQRGAPDVAWDADVQTGVAVDVENATYIVGGTSVGAPSWAGLTALMDQYAGRNLGWINPTLYSLNASEIAKSFHDVTVGNNNPSSAAPGWDELTGLGSPNVGYLAQALKTSGGLSVGVGLATGPTYIPFPASGTLVNGSVLEVTANVTKAGANVTTGTVEATLFSADNQNEGTITMLYNSTMDLWAGNYTVQGSAPPGEWTAVVAAVNGTDQGTGYGTFSVGDGITFGPNTCFYCFYLLSDYVDVYAVVTAADGSTVTTGTYQASFNFGGPGGKSEGSVPLTYNPISEDWEGLFIIPTNADQGAWTMTVSGNTSSTLGSAYTWLDVGLPIQPFTDSPTYVVGDTVEVGAMTGSPGGAFNATVSNGGVVLGTAPLTFSGLLDGGWYGSFGLTGPSAAGFDTVAVSGGDGFNYGNFSTVVRVAPDSLNVAVGMSKANIAVNDTSCVYDNGTSYYNCGEMVSAQVSYPGGATVTQGNVVAFVSLEAPAENVPMNHAVLTYDPTAKAFVGLIEVPAIGPSPYLPAIGHYQVDVVAYDPMGNFGTGSSEYSVDALSHLPISITSAEDFTSANGVVYGNGSAINPFLIEGWYTSQIVVSGSMNSSYLVVDNWVQGSAGDGILLSTPNVQVGDMNPLAWYNFEAGNAGNGLQLADTPGGAVGNWVGYNLAGWNGLNGVLINDSWHAYVEQGSQSAGNGANGVEFLNSGNGGMHDSSAFGNALSGILFVSSPFCVAGHNTEAFNTVGINDTGSSLDNGYWNDAYSNNIGVFVNGLWQGVEEPGHTLQPLDGGATFSAWNSDDAESNNIGMLLVNNSLVGSWDSSFIGNGRGVVSTDSTLLMEYGTQAFNSYQGILMNGMATDGATVYGDCSDSSGLSNIVDCNFAYMNGFGDGDPAPNLAASNLWNTLFYENEGVSSGGSDTELVNVTGSAVVYTIATGSGGDGFDAQNVADSLFIVASVPSQWCQDVCNLYLPAPTGNGLSIVGGGWNEVAISYFDQNGGAGVALSGTIYNEMDEDEMYNNSGPGILVGDSAETSIYTADVENNLGSGVEITSSNFTLFTESDVANNSNTSPTPSFGINVDPSSINTTITYNVINYSWAGVGFTATANDTAQNNLICHNYVGIYIDNSVNGTYAPNNFCSNTIDVWTNPPVAGSYTIVGTGKQTLGTTNAFYATVTNNLLYKPSAIIWFEVDNAQHQEVMVAGVSPDVGPLQTGTVYLALGTLPPGTYSIRAFAVTDSGVPLSNVVVTATPVP